jgi:hypothetical protein
LDVRFGLAVTFMGLEVMSVGPERTAHRSQLPTNRSSRIASLEVCAQPVVVAATTIRRIAALLIVLSL